MDRFQHYIDGAFETPARHFHSLDPATGQPWAEMPDASAADVARAVEAAHRAFLGPAWSGLTA
ncbi:MAG: aldehyde dehydrogenase family protein, partial [Paracoccaceae bacterium]